MCSEEWKTQATVPMFLCRESTSSVRVNQPAIPKLDLVSSVRTICAVFVGPRWPVAFQAVMYTKCDLVFIFHPTTPGFSIHLLGTVLNEGSVGVYGFNLRK